MLPFTMDELNAAIRAGDVTERWHPTLPLRILNYSPEVQYSNKWNDITENCRGLILDDEGNIVARPWKKFYNLGQVNLPIQFDDPVEVMDKADGSLGILYPMPWRESHPDYPDLDIYREVPGHAIATRGSFASEQAQFATKLWSAKYSEYDPIPGYTMLFEIIAPWNRIVLNYGDMEDLILLGAVENGTGYYIGPQTAKYLWTQRGHGSPMQSHWPGPVVEVMPYKSISEAMSHMERDNAEGYVIRSHNFMVKLKQPGYLELHRLVTNCSPRTVWEQLAAGKSKSEIVSAFPDEFHDYVGGMIDPLVEAYESRFTEILLGYQESLIGVDVSNRGVYARSIAKHPDKKYFFQMLDGKPIKDSLWSELKPRGDSPLD